MVGNIMDVCTVACTAVLHTAMQTLGCDCSKNRNIHLAVGMTLHRDFYLDLIHLIHPIHPTYYPDMYHVARSLRLLRPSMIGRCPA